MIIVGLTGGIACGKSMVAKILVRKGALLLDADLLAREVVAPGEPAWQEIKTWLGDEYLHEDGILNREKIADLVFSSSAAREKLNSIVHPRVISLMRQRSDMLKKRGEGKVLIWDVPLLFEAGIDKEVDIILVVAAREDIQVHRLMRRDGISKEQALCRIRSQMPLADKMRSADFVIYNNASGEELLEQVNFVWNKITEKK